MLIGIYRSKGAAAYVGDGLNRWPGVHVSDAAVLYRLALEKAPAGSLLHAVAEPGVAVKEIAALVAEKLGVPLKSVAAGDEAQAFFGWFASFTAVDGAASAEATKQLLGWAPKGPGLLEDVAAHYFEADGCVKEEAH